MTDDTLTAMAFQAANDGFDSGDACEVILKALRQVRDQVTASHTAQIDELNKNAFVAEAECERWKAIAEMREQNLRSIEQRIRRETLERVIALADDAAEHHVEPGWSHFVHFSRRLEEELNPQEVRNGK